ncbi:nucleoside phosphatase family-domain-containing protein [Pilobolus umbonatus]|nr:nucleoside phosphatase family-domain-containing protein [Pilobolus umbonatus]
MLINKRSPLPLDNWEDNRRYGIIIDAGSSGSRVYVYSWKDYGHMKQVEKELQGKIPIVERADKDGLKWTTRTEPGLSTYATQTNEVGGYLDPLLNFAKEVVPLDHHASTPIYLMATAGMRLLPILQQNELLETTCNHITSSTSFHISDCNNNIRIIPGELEGVYGWVAINYLMGGFDNMAVDMEQHHTFGFLDMGGASAQIAFEPDHHMKEEHKSDLTQVELRTLDGRSIVYDVFVTTFLGYGSNEARRRYLEERVKAMFEESNGRNLLDEHHLLHFDDPCLSSNLNITDTYSTSVALSLHGTGDFNECMKFTEHLLNKDAECPNEPCLFNGVHTPEINWSVNKFVGISEYWYSSHDILGLGGVYDFIEYENKAGEYCSRDWSTVLEDKKDLSLAEINRYQMQCFKSAWIVNVLHEGIRIPRIKNPSDHLNTEDEQALLEQTIESVESKNWHPPFQSIDTINDIQVSWTLGTMLLHVASQIPLIDHQDGWIGHNTDDEATHDRVDGVKIPLDNQPEMNHTSHSIGVIDDLFNTPKSIAIVIMIFMALCAYFIWHLFKNIRKKRSYQRTNLGPNGGYLGNEVNTGSPKRCNPFSFLIKQLKEH